MKNDSVNIIMEDQCADFGACVAFWRNENEKIVITMGEDFLR